MPATVQRRPVSIATDCSGMETPVMALQNLGVEVNHVFSCDVNKHAKATIMANFPPKIFFDDLTKRDNTKAPTADLYVAGFPCQPFSTAGLQQGFSDARGRGEIFWHVRDYLEQKTPRVFVLENVSGLVKIKGGEYYRAILEALDSLNTYNIYSRILDTKEHGIPHSRRRIYFVGINKCYDDGSFGFPEPVTRPSIELFLDPPGKKQTAEGSLPPAHQNTAYTNVRRALKELSASGCNPLKVPYVVDCDSSGYRMKWMKEASPCITCSRAAGHWVTSRGRRLTKEEMMRLQGMRPKKFKKAVTERQLGIQIGNAMSVNVLERLFVRALPAAGLVAHNTLIDHWARGKPPPATLTPAGARKHQPQQRKRVATQCNSSPQKKVRT
jgi:DNA (cytosine-5)-methyltransferase 1